MANPKRAPKRAGPQVGKRTVPRLGSQASTQGYVPGDFPFSGRFREDVRLDPSQVEDRRGQPIVARNNPVELYPTKDGVRSRWRRPDGPPLPKNRTPPKPQPPQPRLPPAPKRRR